MRILIVLILLPVFYSTGAQNCSRLEKQGDLAVKSRNYWKAFRRYDAALACNPGKYARLNKKMERTARGLVRQKKGAPLPGTLLSKFARGAYNAALAEYLQQKDCRLAWTVSRYCIGKYARNEQVRLQFARISNNPACRGNIEKGRVWKGHTQSVSAIAFSPDGQFLISTGLDSTARVWNMDGEEVWHYQHPEDKLLSTAFSPDGKWLAVGDRAGRILSLPWKSDRKWMQEFVQFLQTPSAGYQRSLISPHFGENMPDSAHAASYRFQESAVQSLAYSRDGNYLLSSGRDGTSRMINTNDGVMLVSVPHQMGLWSAAFAPVDSADPSYLRMLTAGSDKVARLWARDGSLLSQFAGHESMVACAVFSPASPWVFTVSGDSTARLWDLQGQQLRHFIGHADAVWAAAFSPDGRWVATASWDKTVRLWQVNNGKLLQTFAGHTAPVYALAFSPDGRHIASAGADRTVRLWEIGRDCLESNGEMPSREQLLEAEVQLEPEDRGY